MTAPISFAYLRPQRTEIDTRSQGCQSSLFTVVKRRRAKKLIATLLIASATFAGLGLSAFATDDPQVVAAVVANNEAQDAALGDRVETLLRTDIGLAGSRIRVVSRAAVITVAGTVPDEHALRRALDLASGVRGVREVRNALEVELPK